MNLSDIKGLGEKRIAKLASVGINTPMDLIMHFPYKYIDTTKIIDLNLCQSGESVSLFITIETLPIKKFIRKGLSFVKVKARTQNIEISCTWFNQNYIANKLEVGKSFYVMGTLKKFKNSIDITSPILCDSDTVNKPIIPIYKTIKGLPLNILTEGISVVLKNIKINSYLSDNISNKYNLISLESAFHKLHYPQNLEQIYIAARTVTIEDLSVKLCAYNLLKKQNDNRRVYIYKNCSAKLADAINDLPYELTSDQEKVLNEIISAMLSEQKINKLVQGDVGCGKTIIALMCMYYAFLSGYQSVLMAPTEILATQHYKSAIKLFEKYNVKVTLLTGNQSKKERDASLFLIKNGMTDFVIGTHAVFSDDVIFNTLSLVITDEQHRFGVNQRANLENKAFGCDTIVMSATPIPRTLALTLYGDLEQASIKTKPVGKANIITKIVPEYKLDDMFNYIIKKAETGEQTYIVCPRIEDEEETDLLSVFEVNETLKSKIYKSNLNSVNSAILHGKLSEKEKNKIMNEFLSGETQILVATTVIEVGIDVHNATCVVIFNAERYGLSQLHQLRGRVGRGKIDSYCFLQSNNHNENTLQRLKFFCDNSDGFDLAEYDFSQRGAGDFIGTRQHGDQNTLVKINAEIIQLSREIASEMSEDEQLCKMLTFDMGDKVCKYIKSLTLN